MRHLLLSIAIVMIVSASYDKLLVYIGFTLSLFAMLTVIGLMRIRKDHPDKSPAYRTWGYPFTPLIFIAGNGGGPVQGFPDVGIEFFLNQRQEGMPDAVAGCSNAQTCR